MFTTHKIIERVCEAVMLCICMPSSNLCRVTGCSEVLRSLYSQIQRYYCRIGHHVHAAVMLHIYLHSASTHLESRSRYQMP